MLLMFTFPFGVTFSRLTWDGCLLVGEEGIYEAFVSYRPFTTRIVLVSLVIRMPAAGLGTLLLLIP